MIKILALIITGLFFLSGCHEFGGRVRPAGGPHYGQTMPPAHAPAHGRRSMYRYYYYPEARFYFDISRNLYFYLDSRGNWSVSARLPGHLYPYRHAPHVEIEMDIDKPYLKHKHHRSMYPPGQLKKHHKDKKKNKHKKHDDDDDYKKGKGHYYQQ